MSIKGVEDYRPHANEVNSRKAAVLTVVHGLPPHSLGGTEVAALRLAKSICCDFNITFFYPSQSNTPPFGLKRDHKKPIERATFSVDPTQQKDFSSTFNNHQVEGAFQALLDAGSSTGQAFDLVHIHHLTGLSMDLIPMARAQQIPVLLTLHDYWMACGRGQLMDLDLALCKGPTLKGCGECLGDQLALGTATAAIGRRLRSALSNKPRSGHAGKNHPEDKPKRPLKPSPIWQKLEKVALKVRRTRGKETQCLTDRLHAAKRAFQGASAINAPSDDLLRRFEKMHFPGVKKRGLVLGNIPPTLGPSANNTPPLPLRLIFVGSVIPTKGVHLLVDALNKLRHHDIHLDILGPIPAFHRYPNYGNELKEKSPPNVRWLGAMPPKEVAGHVRKAHALVLPSIWHENAPVTLREALLQGIPVIASRAGGIPEVVEDDVNGLLFERDDGEDLKRAILKMAVPATWVRLSQGAKNTPANKIGASPQEWSSLYRSLIKNQGD